jgi:RNA polymerase sigma-70 factor (ECF subfamily)
MEQLPEVDVRATLQAIPDEARIAVYLVDVEGFRYQDIAEIMGTPVGTVMSQLRRGRRWLHAQLSCYALARGLLSKPTGTSGGGPAPSPEPDRTLWSKQVQAGGGSR